MTSKVSVFVQNQEKESKTDKLMDWRTNEQTDKRNDKPTIGLTDRRTYWRMDGWTDGRIDQHSDKNVTAKESFGGGTLENYAR